jgi:hypothetical protein
VSSKTSFLVVGLNPGSKLHQAKKWGIPVLEVSEFLNLIKLQGDLATRVAVELVYQGTKSSSVSWAFIRYFVFTTINHASTKEAIVSPLPTII